MLVLMRWLAGRQLATLHAWGAWLGWLAWALSPAYRRRLDSNAVLAGLRRAQRRSAVAEAGRLIAELPWLWLRPPARPLGTLIRWQGEALIDAALARGHGVVILTPHLGCFEVCAQAFAERYAGTAPLTVMYRPARQPWLRELQRTARDRPGLATAPATMAGVRQMIRALRRGETVGLLPDQVPPQGMGVWAPFFGRPAYTMTLAARLVQQTGATLLSIWGRRLERGAGFEVLVSAPAPLPAAAADSEALQVECATSVNADMERLIRQCPGQYLWGYNRYKTPRQAPAAEAIGGAA